jgi:thioredoxin-related protein
MNKLLIKCFALWCFFLLTSHENLLGQGINFFHDEPFDKILSLAKEQNKIIFIDGYTTHCAPCKQLDNEVFPLQKVGDYFNSNFINAKYDLDKPEGKKLFALYRDVITGFPSLILIDKNGKMIHKIGGFLPADSLIMKMQAALNGRSLSAMRARLQAGEKSVAFVQEYQQIMKDGFLTGHSGSEGERVNRAIIDRLSDEEMLNPQMWKLVGYSVTDPYAPAFARVVKKMFKFRQKNVTDMGKLEFQLRDAIRLAADQLLKFEEKEDKLVLKRDPVKQATLLSYLAQPDMFKQTESIKTMFYIHDLAQAAKWGDMITALKHFNAIQVLGPMSTHFISQHVQYMKQSCKDKNVLTAAAALLESLPKGEKV